MADVPNMALVMTEMPKAFTNTEHRNNVYLLNNSFLLICILLKLCKDKASILVYDVLIETAFGSKRNFVLLQTLFGMTR